MHPVCCVLAVVGLRDTWLSHGPRGHFTDCGDAHTRSWKARPLPGGSWARLALEPFCAEGGTGYSLVSRTGHGARASATHRTEGAARAAGHSAQRVAGSLALSSPFGCSSAGPTVRTRRAGCRWESIAAGRARGVRRAAHAASARPRRWLESGCSLGTVPPPGARCALSCAGGTVCERAQRGKGNSHCATDAELMPDFST